MNGLRVSWKRRFTDRYILRRADTVVALSAAEKEFLARGQGIDPSYIAVIPNGIDTSIFDRTGFSEPAAELLFVGQLQEFKGLDYLLEALPAIRRSVPEVKLRVVYQTGALLNHYRAQALRLQLSGNVHFAGARSPAELARLYSAAAVVISPSLGECLSTVVLEAMCCGAAVVATDVGGIREQLDESTGIIVPPRNPAALALAVNGLLADPGRRHHLGQAAQQKVRAQFSIRKMIDRHLRLYEELLYTDERAA